MFQKIEDFRFTNRFQTRNQATIELIRLGLEEVIKKNKINITEKNTNK